ncbi:MAG TPA: molybdopterin-dependent oxidoreductase [Deltaproteobacteria bacterium]|nr:molybdopterin-dependent oxidoreductase [Deltaproteobacteria bacterium]
MGDEPIISACTKDCPDACSLVISREHEGLITLGGNPGHPVTRGFTCAKVRSHLKRVNSPERILYPLMRSGAAWELISWDEALGVCADRIRSLRSEPSSILYFHGEGAKGVLKQAGHLFFSLLGASRVSGSFCDSAGFSACVKDFGSRETSDVETLKDARAIVNWGKDIPRSSVHMAALVQSARKNGVRVLTISPGGDTADGLTDLVVRIRPGTDRFLAAAVIRLLLDRGAVPEWVLPRTANGDEFRRIILGRSMDELLAACGCTRDDAERVYGCYTELRPAASIIGAGVQRYSFGGENVRFINALALLSGNIGIRGGGSHFHLNSLRNLNLSWTRVGERKDYRFLRMPVIGADIAEAHDPSIRMVWADGSNLVNQAPGALRTASVFEQVEFSVVVDAFMTDTAARADLVLPCTLMLEQEDVVASYMHDYVQYAGKALDPPGEARSDFEILTELGKRLDPPIVLPAAEACLHESLRSPYLDISLDELRRKGFARAGRPEVAYAGLVFDHADGLYRFPAILHGEPDPPGGYPLRLLSLVRREAIHSQILPEDQEMPPKVWVSPESAVLASLDRDKPISLVTPLGRLRVNLMTMDGLHPEVVVYRRGDWMKLGGGVNGLIEPHITDMGTGTAYYDQYARLEND